MSAIAFARTVVVAFMTGCWLSAAAADPTSLQAPAGLQVSATAGDAVSLRWDAVAGASGYYLYRDGKRVATAPLRATMHTDTGLEPGQVHAYTVSAQFADGEGARSEAVSGAAKASFECGTVSASNYQHVQAGRAHASGAYALANGSEQNLGLNNNFTNQTLAQTAPNHYVIGSCP